MSSRGIPVSSVRVLTASLAVALLPGAVASAQGGRGEERDTGSENADSKDSHRAFELFRESAELFRKGRFRGAAELLEEAYSVEPNPVLLYNLGRARESAGDLAAAIEAYRQYLEEAPESLDRGAIEARIETLQEQASRGARTVSSDAVLEQLDEIVAKRLMERGAQLDSRSQDGRKAPTRISPVVPWTIAGVGATAAITGMVLHVVAQGKHDDALAEPTHLRAIQLQDDAETLNTVGNILLVTGGVIALGGASWGLYQVFGSPAKEGAAQVARPGITFELGLTQARVRGHF